MYVCMCVCLYVTVWYYVYPSHCIGVGKKASSKKGCVLVECSRKLGQVERLALLLGFSSSRFWSLTIIANNQTLELLGMGPERLAWDYSLTSYTIYTSCSLHTKCVMLVHHKLPAINYSIGIQLKGKGFLLLKITKLCWKCLNPAAVCIGTVHRAILKTSYTMPFTARPKWHWKTLLCTVL